MRNYTLALIALLLPLTASAELDITHHGYLELRDADGNVISRHTQEKEVYESASRQPAGTYTVPGRPTTIIVTGTAVPEPEPEPPAPEPEPVGPQPTTVTWAGETSLDALASFTYGGVTPYTWDWRTGFAQPDGRLEITMVAPPARQRAVSLISRGPMANAAGTFGVWIWDNEVHARFGADLIFRSETPDLTPGETHTITMSWGSGFTLMVDGRVTIHHPSWAVAMADRAEPVQMARDDAMGMEPYAGEASFAVFATPVSVEACGVGSLNFTPNPDECGGATVYWQPPTENVDNTPLTDLAAYRLYWGRASGNYTDSVMITDLARNSLTVPDLTRGDSFYFAMTAIDSEGEESSYSNEINRVAQ